MVGCPKLIDTASLNVKQRQIYEQFKDDPDFDMEKALAKFQKAPAQARQVKRVKDTNESVSRELRLVIEFLHRKVELVQRKCIVCARTFAADYLYVALCSDTCRAQYIFAEYGIAWDPDKPERERWNGEPPSIIKPETLEFLVAFAENILAIPNASHYVGRRSTNKYNSDENNAAAIAPPTVRINTSDQSNRDRKSETSNGEVRDISSSRIEIVTQVRQGEKAQALKKQLAAGEISKVEYQLALADLF